MRNLIDAIVGASACILAVFLAIVTIGSLIPDDEEKKP